MSHTLHLIRLLLVNIWMATVLVVLNAGSVIVIGKTAMLSLCNVVACVRVERSLSSQSVAPHLRILRWCGFCRLLDAEHKKPATLYDDSVKRLHTLYRGFTLALTVLYLLQECVYAYQVQLNMDKLARVMFLLLCHITSIAKQLVFYVKAARIDALISGLDEPPFNQPTAHHRLLLRATAASAEHFVHAYSGAAIVTCTLWITFPVIDHLRAQPVEFPFWIIIDYNRSHTMFYLVLMYSYYVTTLVGIANTTMDAFMATMLNQCKTQLRILRINLETLTQRAPELIQHQPELSHDAALSKLFLECLTHYNKITETMRMLQDIFGTAILIQFGIGGWILCMAAYQIVSLSVLSIEFASMTLFISCILTELFLYCYYGNEVTEESGRVSESIYSMEWSRAPVSFQRSLLVVMERAKRPLRPAAGLVIPLSLETFVKIIKSSYTFYAVLRQTKET